MSIGSIIAYAGSSIPSRFLECNGAEISRTAYADLFRIIGTTYGSGNGSTTFNLPNLSGKAPLGVSGSHAIGSAGGSASHSLLSAETPSHTHTIPQHTHGNNIQASGYLYHNVTQPEFQYTRGVYDSELAMSGSVDITSTTSAMMTSKKDLTVADHPATACTVTGGVTDCPAFNTESTGSGTAHNNMMPYLAVTYLIEAVPEPGMAVFNGCCVTTAGGGYITGVGV